MSASMRLYLAPDSDQRAFTGAPKTLQLWLRYPRSMADAWLHQSWRDLDALISATPGCPTRSPLTPAGADWIYPTAADHGAHALSPEHTRELLATIERIGPPEVDVYVRERYDRHNGEGAAAQQPDDFFDREVEELMGYLSCLQDACVRAQVKGYGLIMALWSI
ncbi:MAG TPA: hypothetical protein VG817_07410 [Gemmatimonadales bacterium]|nr:hypothetical protein [Gemmatimonadales bacterium]